MCLSSLNRAHKSFPKDANININISLTYTDSKYRRNRKRIRSKSSLNKFEKDFNSAEINQSNEINDYKKIFDDENVDLDISNVLHDENSLQGNLNVTSNKKINTFIPIDLNGSCLLSEEGSFLGENQSEIHSFINSYTTSPKSISPKRDYFSINSNTIQGVNYSRSSIRSEELNLIPINTKSYLLFYFEINYLMIWVKELLKSTYPELNFILLIEVDDNVETQEKIFLNKTNENFKYIPMLKKEDMNYYKKCYRCLKTIEIDNYNSNFSEIHKISFQLYTYAKSKLLLISQEDMFIKIRNENQMQKYKLYRNMYMKNNDKKIANIMLNFIYMRVIDHTVVKNNLNIFSKIEKTLCLQEESHIDFVYYGIKNLQIMQNGSNCSNNDNFFSINDIEDFEISGELKKGKLNIEKLIEFLSLVKKKYEFYDILKKFNECASELDSDKLLILKERVLDKFEEILILSSKNNEMLDKILIPYLFFTLENLFFKTTKKKLKKISNLTKIKSLEDDEVITVDFKKLNNLNNLIQTDANLFLYFKSFHLSLKLIEMHHFIHNDILISALNYLNKLIDQTFEMDMKSSSISKINSLTETVSCEHIKKTDQFFLNILINKNYHETLTTLLINHIRQEGCVMSISKIFSKVFKSKDKNNSEKLIETILKFNYQNNIPIILNTHECNSSIIGQTIFLMYCQIEYLNEDILNIIKFKKLREIFLSFKNNNFDIIHEKILQLIKAILTKKTSENIINYISNDEYFEIITVFASSFLLIKNKIASMDLLKLSNWTFNMMTIVYTKINILNNFNKTIQSDILINFCNTKKITEIVIEFFYTVLEKKLYTNLIQSSDYNLLNTKLIIIRTMLHAVTLIRTLKLSNPMTKITAEKMYKIIKNIEDNSTIFNPSEIQKSLEKKYLDKKNSDVYKNLTSMNNNLLDYYSRYKAILPEFVKELIIVLK